MIQQSEIFKGPTYYACAAMVVIHYFSRRWNWKFYEQSTIAPSVCKVGGIQVHCHKTLPAYNKQTEVGWSNNKWENYILLKEGWVSGWQHQSYS